MHVIWKESELLKLHVYINAKWFQCCLNIYLVKQQNTSIYHYVRCKIYKIQMEMIYQKYIKLVLSEQSVKQCW